MKSPLLIIAELLMGLIDGTINTIRFVLSKLIELMITLLFYSTFGIYGVIMAVVIGGVVFFLVTKYVFKSSRTIISLGIALVVIVAVLSALSLI